MKFLRTVSTRRLLALIAGLVVAGLGGTAIAMAAIGSGPVPAAKPLAAAAHSALSAPAPAGITARITFTNHLIDALSIQRSDPILTGATGRLWLSPSEHRLRLELQSDNGDAQIVVDNGAFWVYDPSANTVYRGQLPPETSTNNAGGIPSLAELQTQIAALAHHVTLSGAIPGDVAGQPAYTVRFSPKHDGGLLGAGELAWDAANGVPLRIAVYAHNSSSPVLELKATDVSFGAVPASEFAVTPPSNAKVVNVSVPAGGTHSGAGARSQSSADVTGVAAVAKRVKFKLVAKDTLVGLPRRSVQLLDWSGSPAALVTYGQNLGGIAVIEQPAQTSASLGAGRGGRGGRLSLPTVSINGVSAQELDTALGTVVHFTRGDVDYTVLGSVPPAAADAAARALR